MKDRHTLLELGDVTPDEAHAFVTITPLITKALEPFRHHPISEVKQQAALHVANAIHNRPMADKLLARLAADARRSDEHLAELFDRARELVIQRKEVKPWPS